MANIRYQRLNFRADTRALIDTAIEILEEYTAQGYELTLRQLYYQFVARDIIPNNERSYKRMGTIVNNGRLAGLIDWDHITDRTREEDSNSHWSGPGELLEGAISQYAIDKWQKQPYRIECWVEKDALIQVIEKPCSSLDITWFSCRGYVSQSAMWRAGMRMRRHNDNNQKVVLLHLGDHDPSGIDMTRDIRDRLRMFGVDRLEVRRIGLTMDQIDELNPPPNPTKLTDSRSADYVAEFGDSSWELDALEPSYIDNLIRDEVLSIREDKTWNKYVDKEEKERGALERAKEDMEQYLEDN